MSSSLRLPEKISAKCISVVALLFALNASAGGVTGRITILQVGHGYTPDNVYALVTVDGTATDQPACTTDQRFAINPATNAGKALLAVLTTAKALGQVIRIFGTGNCNVVGSGQESISYSRVYD